MLSVFAVIEVTHVHFEVGKSCTLARYIYIYIYYIQGNNTLLCMVVQKLKLCFMLSLCLRSQHVTYRSEAWGVTVSCTLYYDVIFRKLLFWQLRQHLQHAIFTKQYTDHKTKQLRHDFWDSILWVIHPRHVYRQIFCWIFTFHISIIVILIICDTEKKQW